ncbi:MAG: sigma-70 family RNA polymerase sigma factor [Ilumatobacteraceae bacterium]
MAPPTRPWTDLRSPSGFERCIRGTFREVYGYVALLAGDDRAESERLVAEVYRSLFRAVQDASLGEVGLAVLRRAARELWVEPRRDRLRSQAHQIAWGDGEPAPAVTLADLSAVERAVLVLRHVNLMDADRVAAELGVDAPTVRRIDSRSIVRLRGADDVSGSWIRAYYGRAVTPAPRLVDRIVRALDDPSLGALRPAAHHDRSEARVHEPGSTGLIPIVTSPREGSAGAGDIGDVPFDPALDISGGRARPISSRAAPAVSTPRRRLAPGVGVAIVAAAVVVALIFAFFWMRARGVDADAAARIDPSGDPSGAASSST